MSFGVVFAIVATIVGIGFVTVFGVIIYSAVRSATDPEYRARIAARPRPSGSAHPFTDTPTYNPVLDPGNPASPMFPSDPGNPGTPL